MTPRRSVPARLALCLFLFAVFAAAPANARSPLEGGKSSGNTTYRFSYSPIYQFETSMDNDGRFDVQRHLLRFEAARSMGKHWSVGLGLSFDYEHWNFSNISSLFGVDLWEDVFRPGISIPIFYDINANWRFGIIPSVEFAGASGAKIDKSISYGSVFSAAYAFGPDLILGVGTGVFERFEQWDVFPFFVVDWKIDERLRLTNPLRAGPVGPAGLELVYSPLESLEVGVGGAYRSYRFRLRDRGAVPNGIADVDFWSPFARLGWRLSDHYQVDLSGGALVGGRIAVEDEKGHRLGRRDYDATPFVGITFRGRF